MSETHFVEAPCNCEHDDPERCATVRYVSDIRIAFEEINRLSQAIDDAWSRTKATIAAA